MNRLQTLNKTLLHFINTALSWRRSPRARSEQMARGKKKKKENRWRRLKLADPLICFQTQGGERVCLDSALSLCCAGPCVGLWVSVFSVVRYGTNTHRPAAITRRKGCVIFPSLSGPDKSDIPCDVKSGCDLSPIF